MNLPHDSRCITKISPVHDWNWDRETQSRILAELDKISVLLTNMFRKKGTKKAKPSEQWQPEYVKIAKEKAAEEATAAKRDGIDQRQLESFFKKRYREVKFQ